MWAGLLMFWDVCGLYVGLPWKHQGELEYGGRYNMVCLHILRFLYAFGLNTIVFVKITCCCMWYTLKRRK